MHNYIAEVINVTLQFGGERVTEAQTKERLEVCARCDRSGIVKVAGFEMEGCTKCGCPFATKPLWKKYFSFAKMRIVKTECPHPDGNKWKEVDSKYS